MKKKRNSSTVHLQITSYASCRRKTNKAANYGAKIKDQDLMSATDEYLNRRTF